MFGNQSNQNTSQPNNNNIGSSQTGANSSGLFSNTSSTPLFGAPSGGLFGSVDPKLSSFANNKSNDLKTSERKSGGLFDNVGSDKPLEKLEAPKLNFPFVNTASNNNSLLSSNPNLATNPSLFTNSGNSLFSLNTSTPTGSLFGNPSKNDANTKKSQKQKGLFFGASTDNQPSLFNKKDNQSKPDNVQKPQSLFGTNNTTPLFGKKQTSPSLFGSQTPSFLSNPTPQGGLFGGIPAKKQQINNIQQQNQSKADTSGSFNVTATPNTPLFTSNNSASINNNSQQVPKFSLTGNISSNQILINNSSSSAFNKINKKNQTNPSQPSQKKQIKPPQSTSGLFGGITTGISNPTSTQSSSPIGGSLFNNSKDQAKKSEGKTKLPSKQKQSSQAHLSDKQIIDNKNKQQPEVSVPSFKATISNQGEGSNKLLATFSNDKIQQTSSNNLSRQARTISFDQTGIQNAVHKPEKLPQKMERSTVKPSMFSQATQKASTEKPKQNKQVVDKSNLMQNTKNINQSSMGRSRMTQQSFFKSQFQQRQQKKSPIYTAHQINKILKQKIKLSMSLDSRSSNQRISRQTLKSIQDWVSISFSRFNQIATSQQLSTKYALHSDDDINRFLNDIGKQIIMLLNLPYQQKSFQLVNKLFFELLEKLGIKEYLFNCTKIQVPQSETNKQAVTYQIVQLNTGYFLKHQIYKFTPEAITLNLDSEQFQHYVTSLAKKYITNQLQYLQFLQNKPELLKLPFGLFYSLLSYCLKYKKMRFSQSNLWSQKNPQLIQLIKDFEKKMIRKIILLLSNFVSQNFYNYVLVNNQLIPQLVNLLENFSYTQEEELIDISLKVILNSIQLGGQSSSSNKFQVQLSPQMKNNVKQTKSLQLLPFRTLLSILQNNHYRVNPSSHDLYRYINGPQWLDWLQIYLNSSTEKQVPISEAHYMIRILKFPTLGVKRLNRQNLTPKQMKYIENLQKKVLSRKRPIFKFIMALKQQNMLNIFYEILISLIYDYDSYRRIQQLFFKQKDEFNYQFRNIIAQISNYPTQQFKEEIPFMEEKVLYFLRIVQVAPQRTLALEKLIFQGFYSTAKKSLLNDDRAQQKNILESSDVGHKICHLIIDSINYFGLKNNQKIVARCISAIKSLLQNEETALSMKIAMAVNKPEMLFATSLNHPHLVQNLISQMLELLQFFLASQQFFQTVTIHLRTNNSEGVNLQRMYAVRYSEKDYLPFVKQICSDQYISKTKKSQSNSESQLAQVNIILTYSSYWLVKSLEVFVQAVKQQKVTSSSNQKSLLYLMNLILEKLFIPLSHKMHQQNERIKMTEQSMQNLSNPIYSVSSLNSIPKVFQFFVEALNTIDLIHILSENLKYKLLRSGHIFDSASLQKQISFYLANQRLEQDFARNQYTVFLSVKILKQLLQVYRVYQQYKYTPLRQQQLKSGQNHFVYKLLSKLKWIQDIQFWLFLKSYTKNDILQSSNEDSNSRTNLVIGLMALVLIDSKNDRKPYGNRQVSSISQSKPVNLKQQNYQKPYIVPIESNGNKKASSQLANFSQIESFYSKFGQTLNYQSINNFLINGSNRYIESYQSIECLTMQCLSLLISGQVLFGDNSCRRYLQSTINLTKYIGFYNISNLSDTSRQLFSNQWLLQKFESQISEFLVSATASIQIKKAILDFLHQIIKSDQSNSNFVMAKRIVYKYLVRHLDQSHNYSEQQIIRINVVLMKILNLLQEKDYNLFSQYAHDKLLDALLSSMINNCSKCIKSSTNLAKLIVSFQSKQFYEPQLSYYHLERTLQERQIVKTAQAYQLLKLVIDLIERRFFSYSNIQEEGARHKWKCIKRINWLIINLNLSYLSSTVIDRNFANPIIRSLALSQQKSRYFINTNIPRSFNKNPLEVYLSTSKAISFIYTAFGLYKQNIIDWLSFYSIQLGEKVLRFLTWVLTVDRNLYGNQPIAIRSKQLLSPKYSNTICSQHMGNYNHTAIQLFADSQNQAINMIKTLYDQSIRNLQKGMSVNQVQCFYIMGYCLEWLRARQVAENILEHLVKNTIKNPFWIDNKTIQNSAVIKLILSLVSIGKEFMINSQFKKIRQPIFDLIHKFREGKTQIQQTSIQQLISVLTSIPPEIQDSRGVNQILNIWKTQTNYQFFYNQSRFILQICETIPNQVAKLKSLSSCQKIKKSSSKSHYSYNLRYPDSISFIWGLKIASTLMSSQTQTVIIFEEITDFYTSKSEQIYEILLNNVTSVSLGYLEKIQALLEFLLSLISSKSWLIVHRQQFQKVTYLLSHKLITLFTDFVNSKTSFVAQSDVEKRFKKIRLQTLVDQAKDQAQMENGGIDTSLDKDSVFKMIMEFKMIECMKLFTVLLTRSFQESWYVHKYFNEEVYQNYRYGVSFWDRINKSVMDLIRYNLTVQKKWKKMENVNQKLILINDCITSAEFFVETGYLSSLFSVPSNSDEVFEELHSLSFSSLQLATVHFIQQKTFKQKYQCLMKGNIQKYGKKLFENVKQLESQFQIQQLTTLRSSLGEIKKSDFQKIQKNLANMIKTI